MADKVDVRKTLIVAQQVAEQQRVDAMEAGKDRLAASKQAQVDSLRAATLAFDELLTAAKTVVDGGNIDHGKYWAVDSDDMRRLRSALASLAGAAQ